MDQQLPVLAFAGSLWGLQMCLDVKGWVRRLALTYLFLLGFVLYALPYKLFSS
jgi:hypothetical protein